MTAKQTDERVGKRLEIAPHYDLWMMGARYGTVTGIGRTKDGREVLRVKMDHPQVRRIARILSDDGVMRWL